MCSISTAAFPLLPFRAPALRPPLLTFLRLVVFKVLRCDLPAAPAAFDRLGFFFLHCIVFKVLLPPLVLPCRGAVLIGSFVSIANAATNVNTSLPLFL